MARLTILIALLAVLLFIAHTSAYKTTITTVEIDDFAEVHSSSSQGEGRCTQKLQKVNLKHCEQHIMQRIGQQEEDEEEDVLTLRGLRNRRDQGLDQCCYQLRELDDQKCQCQALQQIMQKQSGKLKERETQEMKQELKKLPQMCGMEPLQGCKIRSMDY